MQPINYQPIMLKRAQKSLEDCRKIQKRLNDIRDKAADANSEYALAHDGLLTLGDLESKLRVLVTTLAGQVAK